MADSADPTTAPKTCCLCGNEGKHDTRYAAIAARTYYEGKLERKHFVTGGVAIWELQICAACMPRARLSYADGEIRSARSAALVGVGLFVGGLASVVLSNLTHQLYHLFQHHHDLAEDVITGPVSGQETMFLLAVGFALIAGPLMAVIGAVLAIRRSRRRRQMSESDVVPAELVEKCFKKEADTMLALLNNAKKNGRRVGDESLALARTFPLPAFKEIAQLSEEERTAAPPAKRGRVSKIWVRLQELGESREDLIAKLPEKWNQSAVF